MGTIRELTSHRVNGLNEALRIFVLDEPGAGNACHDYVVLVPWPEPHPEAETNEDRLDYERWHKTNEMFPNDDVVPANGFDEVGHRVWWISEDKDVRLSICTDTRIAHIGSRNMNVVDKLYYVQRINFQNGPVKEKGYNGNSHEALLAILLDRMESFQNGPFAGRDNAMALTKLDEARLWLHKRTMDRVSRGVEGTHQK